MNSRFDKTFRGSPHQPQTNAHYFQETPVEDYGATAASKVAMENSHSNVSADDARISQLLRQLKRSAISKLDRQAIDELFEKLQQRIKDPANKGYINRSFDTIADDVVCLLLESPRRLYPQIVYTFACVGHVLHANGFQKFFNFIVKCYKSSTDGEKVLRLPLMDSLRQTVKMNSKLPTEVAQKVIRTLKEIMENVDAEVFICVSDTMDELAQAHPAIFKRYFKDVVDIIIGWHLEVDKSGALKLHCGRVLQNLGGLWTRELEFTKDLVVHVKEDIEASESEPMGRTQFGCYVGAFNTIIKCLNVSGEFCLDANFLADCFSTVLTCISNVFQVAQFTCGFDILVNANEFMLLTVESGIGDEFYLERVLFLAKQEFELLEELSDEQICSVVYLVSRLIPRIVTTHSEWIQSLFMGNPILLQKRFTKDSKLRLVLIEMYQTILNLKNVQILKHIYTEIIRDTECARSALKEPQNSLNYTPEQAQLVIAFNLNCLSKLAMDNTSIIALYACQPSLLEVLVTVLQPHAIDSPCARLPELQNMVINMIFWHCKQNKNFSMSSNLLKGTSRTATDYTKESPTCEHFEIILELLCQLLDQELPPEVAALVHDWSFELVSDAKGNDHFYDTDKHWRMIAQRMIESARDAIDENDEILRSGRYLEQIVQLPTLMNEFAEEVAEICCSRIDSTNSEVADIYCGVLARVPLNVALNTSFKHVSNVVHLEAYWRVMIYGNRSESDVWPCHFEELFKALAIDSPKKYNAEGGSSDQNARQIIDVLWECFNKCRRSADEQFVELALSNSSLLVGWMSWELAKFCVNNKLKTPLGKPQELFLHIEGLVRKIARMVDGKEAINCVEVQEITANQVKSRIILGFVEALEKCIYNAAEGTAYSYPALEKPIRAFFKLNATTCSEWFKRNRIPIEVVGTEMMDSDTVIRNAEASLRVIGVNCSEVNVPLFEHNLVALVRAFLRLGDSHSILGLKEWTRPKDRSWIKTAAEQANNHFQAAGKSYLVLLVTEEEMNKVVKDFVAEQMFVCFAATGNYAELTPYLKVDEYKELIKRNVPQFMNMYAGADVVGECPETMHRLSNWEQVTALNKTTNKSLLFSMRGAISKVESNLILATNTFKSDVDSRYSLNALTREAFRTKSEELLPELMVLQHVSWKIAEKQLGRSPEIASLGIDKCFGSKYLNKVLNWAQMLNVSKESSAVLATMQMDLISVARKEKNLDLAARQLEQFFSSRLLTNEQIELENIPRLLIENDFSKELLTEEVVRASFEASKVLYASAGSRDKAIQLLSHINLMVDQRDKSQSHVSAQLRARMLLKVADCISQKEDDVLNRNKEGPVQELLQSLDEFTSIAHFNSESVVPLHEISVGKLLSHTVKLCPEFGKSWCIYGNWCYKWGRKILELSHSKKHKSSLQYDYNTEIRKIVPNVKTADIQTIINVLDDLLMTDNDNDDIGPNDADSERVAVTTLKALPCLSHASTEKVIDVIGLWHKAHRHVYGCYEMAANAYFKFLQMDNAEEENLHQHSVMITLRLLRLIVKHALSLHDVLDSGLATTPTGPWKTIIPQLFSRLNHHELYVRKRVSELLCRVAKDSPHIIIFPAVVGCGQGRAGDISNVLVGGPHESSDGNENRELLACFQALVTTLSKQAADKVAQVQVLVRELQRIGLLWDELWLVGLTRVYAEFNKKMQLLETENTRKEQLSEADKNQLNETTHQFRATLLSTIEKLDSVTGGVAETRNEMNFQTKYKRYIEALREAAKKGGDKGSKKIWNQFKTFYGILHQRASKRSASILKMEDISPVLFNLQGTVISMPGVATEEGSQIYIRSVANTVQILPTKTRPKKLAFIGDDNRQYNYLFKGLEDLHLDERIMQFLCISNTIMRKASQKVGYNYRARHYSVIPLGTQSGLINWVDGVIPIFSLYKKWQQREVAKAKKANEKEAAVMRPSELFYSKITPLLQEHKLDVSDNRKTWPVSVLRQVLDELAKETPKDLLAKEFWCNSTTTAGWRRTVKNYALSVAVMSVIGYIIGLGDRHLDNVLVDVATGEILHIDFNVCFEKGKTLRVPEKIPFRMTQNFQDALGLTGVEGTFRLTCETVLQSLKKGRETLLTLLEAFVYDPLVDWTVNQEDGGAPAGGACAEKKPSRREAKAQSSTPAANKANADNQQRGSLKQQWKTSRDEVQKSNYALEECQRGLATKLEQKQTIAGQLAVATQELQMISGFSVDQCQILAMKYDTYHALRNAVQEKYDWSERVISVHKEYFAKFDDGDLVHFVSRFPAQWANASVFEFEAIQPIFVTANHLELFTKSRELALDMTSAVGNVGQTMQAICELFGQYKLILSQLPDANSGNHFLHMFRSWCDGLSKGFTAFELSTGQCQLLETEIRYGGPLAAVGSVAVTSFAHGLLTNIQELSIQHQMLSVDGNDREELEGRYAMAKERIMAVEGGEGRSKLLHLNFNVLWQLHKKYKLVLSSDMSKLRYEMALNSYIFHRHVKLTMDLGQNHVGDSNVLLKSGFDALEKCTSLYEWMNEIKYKFSEELIPWSVQAIFTGDQHVIEMITKLSQCYPNGELKELEKNLRECLEMTLTDGSGKGAKDKTPPTLSRAVNEIKYQLAELYKSYANERHVGAKIFKRFYELFNSLEQKFRDVIDVLSNANQLDITGGIGTGLTSSGLAGQKQEEEKQKLAVMIISNRNALELVKQLNLVRKVDALIEFFLGVMNNLRAFQGNGDTTVYNDQILFTPFKVHLNDFLQEVMFGIGDHCQALVLKALMKNLKGDRFDSIHEFVNHFDCEFIFGGNDQDQINIHLLRDLSLYWEQQCKSRCIQKMVQGQEVEINRLQMMLRVHEWQYEEIYRSHNIQSNGFSRSQFVLQLRPLQQQLYDWNGTIGRLRQDIGVLGEQIKHDLQWVDTRFKPLIADYESQAAKKEKALNAIQACGEGTLEVLEPIITYEALRRNEMEAMQPTNQLIQLLQQVMIMCSQGVGLSRSEAKIVEMGSPLNQFEGTGQWREEIVHRMFQEIEKLRFADGELEEEINSIEKTIRQETTQLLKFVPGLKTILNEVQNATNPHGEKDCLLARYTRCMDVVCAGLEEIARASQFDRVKAIETIGNFSKMILCLKKTMVELKLDDEATNVDGGRNRLRTETQPKQNSYAVTVWRRVRMKLEGRDPDSSKRMSVEDQVDWMIKEATNPDNLAVLYEGWTPWV